MRKLFYVLLGCLLFITSCIDEPSQARLRIKKHLDSIDNQCPLDMGVIRINGNMVESTKTNGASTIVSLPQKGVYIVKVGNDVFKVSI